MHHHSVSEARLGILPYTEKSQRADVTKSLPKVSIERKRMRRLTNGAAESGLCRDSRDRTIINIMRPRAALESRTVVWPRWSCTYISSRLLSLSFPRVPRCDGEVRVRDLYGTQSGFLNEGG